MKKKEQKKFKKNYKDLLSSGEIFKRLQELTKGLILISEIDSEIDAFKAENKEEFRETIEDLIKRKKAMIETLPAERFFANPTTHRDWNTPQHRKRVERFIKIRDLMSDELADVKLYRIGTTDLDIFVAGEAGDGSIVGIKTRAVET